jgi:tetratricopeptide (TPR) repeat protein
MALVVMLTGAGAIALIAALAPWKGPIGHLVGQLAEYVQWERVAPERPGEVLILVAPFKYLGVPDNLEYRRAGEKIEAVLAEYSEKLHLSVRVEYIPWPLSDAGDISAAEKRGAQKNATVIIWGDIARTRNEIRYLDRRNQKLPLSWSSPADRTRHIDDFQRTAQTDLSGYAEFVNQDLAKGLAFLAHITVADILYFQGETEKVKQLYEKAMEWVVPGHDAFFGPGRAEMVERLIAIRGLKDDALIYSELQSLASKLAELGRAGSEPEYKLEEIQIRRSTAEMDTKALESDLGVVDAIIQDIAVSDSSVAGVDAHILRADILADLDRNTEAQVERTRVLALLDELAKRRFDYGILVRMIELNDILGHYDTAHELVTRALRSKELQTSRFWRWKFEVLQAEIFVEEQKYTQALQAQQTAVESALEGGLYWAKASRDEAMMYLMVGDLAHVEQIYEKLAQSVQAGSWDFNNLGWLYLDRGECEKAMVAFGRALTHEDFLRPRIGQVLGWMCLGNLQAMEVEKTRLSSIRTKLATAPAPASPEGSSRPEYQEIVAALTYLKHQDWTPGALTEDELGCLMQLAVDNFRVNRDGHFSIWLLRSLLDAGHRNEELLSNLGYLYSNEAAQLLRDGHPAEALDYLATHSASYPLDDELQPSLRSLARTDSKASQLMSEAHFVRFHSSVAQLP